MGLKKAFENFLVKQITRLTDNREVYFNVLSDSPRLFSSSFESKESWSRAYRLCAPVSAIINRQAKSFSNGIPLITDLAGQPAKETLDFKRLKNVFRKPNPLQSWNQFISQAYAFRRLYGYAVIFVMPPLGFGNQDVETMWVLPNAYLSLTWTGKSIYQNDIKEIISEVKFNNLQIPLDNLLFFQDTHQDTRMDNNLLSMSRLSSLKDPINNIIASYEARNVLITRRGAIGILSNSGKDVIGKAELDPDEKKDVQDSFRQYGLKRNQDQVIITNATLNWQSMTFPTKDLMLFEEIEDDVRQLCDSLEYPFELLGFKSTGTLGDQNRTREAKKSLYQDVLIPEAEDFVQVINDGLNLEKLGLQFSLSFDHIEVLQQSAKEKNEAARALVGALQIELESNIITFNQWRKTRGWDEVPGGDKYYSEVANLAATDQQFN